MVRHTHTTTVVPHLLLHTHFAHPFLLSLSRWDILKCFEFSSLSSAALLLSHHCSSIHAHLTLSTTAHHCDAAVWPSSARIVSDRAQEVMIIWSTSWVTSAPLTAIWQAKSHHQRDRQTKRKKGDKKGETQYNPLWYTKSTPPCTSAYKVEAL
jgi:hypothetical protein